MRNMTMKRIRTAFCLILTAALLAGCAFLPSDSEPETPAPTDPLPGLPLLNPPAAGRRIDEISRIDHSAAGDPITYWLTDKAVTYTATSLAQTRHLRPLPRERKEKWQISNVFPPLPIIL